MKKLVFFGNGVNLRTNKKRINYKFLHIKILKLYLIAIKNNKFKLKKKQVLKNYTSRKFKTNYICPSLHSKFWKHFVF